MKKLGKYKFTEQAEPLYCPICLDKFTCDQEIL